MHWEETTVSIVTYVPEYKFRVELGHENFYKELNNLITSLWIPYQILISNMHKLNWTSKLLQLQAKNKKHKNKGESPNGLVCIAAHHQEDVLASD